MYYFSVFPSAKKLLIPAVGTAEAEITVSTAKPVAQQKIIVSERT